MRLSFYVTTLLSIQIGDDYSNVVKAITLTYEGQAYLENYAGAGNYLEKLDTDIDFLAELSTKSDTDL